MLLMLLGEVEEEVEHSGDPSFSELVGVEIVLAGVLNAVAMAKKRKEQKQYEVDRKGTRNNYET